VLSQLKKIIERRDTVVQFARRLAKRHVFAVTVVIALAGISFALPMVSMIFLPSVADLAPERVSQTAENKPDPVPLHTVTGKVRETPAAPEPADRYEADLWECVYQDRLTTSTPVNPECSIYGDDIYNGTSIAGIQEDAAVAGASAEDAAEGGIKGQADAPAGESSDNQTRRKFLF